MCSAGGLCRSESTSLFCVWLINLILKSHVPALRCWERKDTDLIQGWTFQLFKIPKNDVNE